MRRNYASFVVFLLLFLLIFTLILIESGISLILTGLLLLFISYRVLDYSLIGKTERRKSDSDNRINSSHVSNESGFFEDYKQLHHHHYFDDRHSVNATIEYSSFKDQSDFQVTFSPVSDMWGKKFGSPAGKTRTPVGLNATLSASPSALRQRGALNGSFSRDPKSSNGKSNFTSNGPLLSSPFMPQIKRALGLEPNSQSKYR